MSVFPNGYAMVPNGMNYTLQPQYTGTNYSVPIQQVQPMQQPVMQMQQPIVQQTPVQTQQPMVIGGKIVDAIEVARASDIPMDGNAYYFPKADGSEIYTKQWTQNGTTDFVIYKRVEGSVQEEPKQQDVMCKEDIIGMQNGLYEKLDSILDRVSRLEEAFK